MGLSEHAIQSAYFDWARLHRRARRAYAIPNGGLRHAAVAAKLKREGVRPGVLDVHVPIAARDAHGLYIEFKAGRNQPTPEQATEIAQLVEDGFAVAVCWHTEDAIKVTTDYLDGQIGPCLMVMKRRASRRSESRSL